ncbi:glycosyltransferase family 39 protein [Alloacidobacterium dinghuense]|uniref:Glycosyltransferase family 39 protein n=1 Tax=Alloacidobacterium dinghuense TaxID=2763107 RepID=A0A7G8BCY8_9BACT|nr:glycosyltransferase family 39 protein [Alloacidobacterium dinghuense]QNI30408.1 glycosyltransferase family 39 protein [Alloacidobacterium dinghuense]
MTESKAVQEADHLSLRQEAWLVGSIAMGLSLMALRYCMQGGMLLLYGDAVAHLHIARRIFDSLNPGFRQLGSVWLPLPHLLLLPFVQKMEWWQTGLAGAWPSMACYVLGCAGIYRLARLWLPSSTAGIAGLFYALNPGLLYMQTTAMTEPLFLAEMIWSALLIAEHGRAMKAGDQKRASRQLVAAGLVLVAAMFTRYDGWIYAAFAWLVVAWGVRRHLRERVGGAFILFTGLLLAAPALWLLYNAKQFGDPLDFLRGPYSAKAIDARTSMPGAPHYPGWHSMRVASLYFLKAAEMGAVPLRWGNLLLWLSLAGTAIAAWRWRLRGIAAALLLGIPLPFYAYSIAYGSVPIFIPLWWPHSWYNVRYGMEMLPVFALFLAIFVHEVAAFTARRRPRSYAWVVIAVAVLVMANSVVLLRGRPLVLQEAVANSRTRIPYEKALANALATMPEQGMILMYTSEHPGALQRAGIPLKRTINEGDYYQWPPALEHPAQSAAIVVATEGDAVARAVEAHPEGLTLVNVVCSTGQPCARIYLAK